MFGTFSSPYRPRSSQTTMTPGRSHSFSRAPVEYFSRPNSAGLDYDRQKQFCRFSNLYHNEVSRLERNHSIRLRSLNHDLAIAKKNEERLRGIKRQRKLEKKQNNAAIKIQKWWRLIKNPPKKKFYILEEIDESFKLPVHRRLSPSCEHVVEKIG